MIPVEIKTLVVVYPPNPSFIVLQPISETPNAKQSKEQAPDQLERTYEPEYNTIQDNVIDNQKVVPIWIGYNEALQLGAALEDKQFERPMTHDLLLNIMTNLDGIIDHIVIPHVKGALFYATIYVRQYDRLISIDARPSDALALAVRQSAPILIDESIIERMGCTFSFTAAKGSEEEAQEIKEFQEFLNDLTPDDFS
ncbi:bifunctional nuclease family protein [Adlercreutzia sp. ZJ138]|uniref:bifunctional nuclease family protein n=1 Tax=Adlercreutzia sp. ZJ138 TaxID=2709405 RepID=UPI0013EBBCDE|nr:bifunctional nuclease family protein [Adlercreutzia sp. ZJ138]